MGFFSKEKEVKKEEEQQKIPQMNSKLPAIPTLPELPALPEFPSMEKIQPMLREQNQLKPLPALPDDSFSNSLSIEAIKSNVSTPQAGKRTIELSDLEEYKKASSKQVRAPPQNNYSKSENKEPIFIKIDKFHDALDKFKEVKKKVGDIEDSLKTIKELKGKEEAELREWEEEISKIKEKVATIDSSLFNKIY
jgi:hypothetical protein